MKYTYVLIYSIIIIYTYIMYYLSWYYWALKFILSLIVYTIIFFWFHIIWSYLRNKPTYYFSNFINYFLSRVSIFLIFATILFWWTSYLLNEVYPAPMPEYTITNWKIIVVFQSMSHIWTENFYKTVENNLTKYKKEWWVYFYEWVKPGSKESLDKFNTAIWIKFDDDLYKNFSKLYWVENQDNNQFMWLVNNLDFNVDMWMDQIVKLYENKTINKEDYESKIPIDANKVIIDTLNQLNERELKVLVYINQAILNFIIWNEFTQTFLTNNFANKDLFDVILDERNLVIKNAIINSKYKKIYMTYWLLHFKWVLELLQENNPKWHIISERNLYPIKS